jgi:CRISPR-associated protein Cas1
MAAGDLIRRGVSSLAAPPILAGIADLARLAEAWRRVRANSGGPGGDGVTLSCFAARCDQELGRLAAELATGRYRPGPLRRAIIPKPDGTSRRLGIPCVRDRVAQTATLALLQPLLEARQSPVSYGYRPARGVADALAAVRAAQDRGLTWTLEADIVQYFDRIPHGRLLAELAIWVEREEVLGLIARWVHGFGEAGRGIAQGAPISPLLANLYLHPLDRLLVAAGHVPVRYADDFVVLSTGMRALEQARCLAEGVLGERGLALLARKTRIVPPGVPFRFLGATLAAPLLRVGKRRG